MISGLKYRNVACFNQVSKTQYGVIITMNMTRRWGDTNQRRLNKFKDGNNTIQLKPNLTVVAKGWLLLSWACQEMGDKEDQTTVTTGQPKRDIN